MQKTYEKAFHLYLQGNDFMLRALSNGMHPAEFCAYWVPILYGIQPTIPGKRHNKAYRDASIALLASLTRYERTSSTLVGWLSPEEECRPIVSLYLGAVNIVFTMLNESRVNTYEPWVVALFQRQKQKKRKSA